MKKIINPKHTCAAILFVILAGGCSQSEQVSVQETTTEVAVAEPTYLTNYIQQPPLDFSFYKEPITVRGIYVTAPRAGGSQYLPHLLDLVNQTEVNAMVIDIKTDDGMITHKGIPIADEMGISRNFIADLPALMDTLYENNIYTIARIVCFKDNGAADAHPDWYIKNPDGSIWRDNSKLKSAWLNPYNRDSWDYVLTFAKEAAKARFHEIQFDYIRFDTSSRLKDADFGDTEGKSRKDIILEFLQYAYEELKPYGVAVSADVYGTIINSNVDAEIVGQEYAQMARYLDYISPMVYPSHYAEKSMGIDYPDLNPYETIYRSMMLSAERLATIPEGEHRAIVRPWLQDFSATWITPHLKYGAKERRDQINAVYDAGLSEWLLWDPSVSYSIEGFERSES